MLLSAPNDTTDADPSELNKKSAGTSASHNGENGPPGAPEAAVAKTPAGRPTWQGLLGGKQTAKEEDVDSPSKSIVWLNDTIEPSSVAMSLMQPQHSCDTYAPHIYHPLPSRKVHQTFKTTTPRPSHSRGASAG
jgi:hypothetical protein